MQIAPGLYSMSQTKGGRVHAFLVDDGSDGLTLIDTLYDDDAGVILDELKSIGRKPTDIRSVALTHSHKSHISGLATIARLSGATVYAHETEIPIIEGRQKAKPVGWKFPRPFNAEVYALQVALNLGIGSHVSWRVDERLKDGDRLGPLEVIHVPGHTKGCVAFFWSERKALITGDTVSSWPMNPEISWPTFDLDHKQAQRSVGKMADLSSVQILCVGHGEPIVQGAADVLKELARKPL